MPATPPPEPAPPQAPEQIYRALMDHTREGVAVMQDGCIVFCNPRAAAISGRSVGEMIGRGIADIFHPADAPAAAARQAARQRGEPVDNEYDIRIVRRDGELRWLHLSVVACEWNGRPASLGLISDITLRQDLEARLQASLAERETILQNALVGITFAVHRTHRWVNRRLEELLGYQPGELVGQSSRIHYDDAAAWETFGAAAYPELAAGRPYRAEVRMRRKDGSPIWLEAVGSAVSPPDLAQGTIWTYLDMTERHRAEEETRAALDRQRQLNELKSRFVSMTSHEFRTPLAAIQSSVEILQRYADRLPDSEKTELHASIVQGVKRMTTLLDNVLLFGRAEAGRIQFAPRELDLRQLCAEIIAELRQAGPAAPTDHHQIRFDWQPAGRLALVDEKLWRHILGNLLANAVKYSPHGGRIDITVSSTTDGLRLEVCDQGIGIPPGDLPDLFTVFHRAANVGAITGTGLGLTIVRYAVERHGGRIDVASTLGQGTCFTVVLPVTVGGAAVTAS